MVYWFLTGYVLSGAANQFVEQTVQRLVETLQTHTNWGIAVMIAVTALMMAAGLISFVLHR